MSGEEGEKHCDNNKRRSEDAITTDRPKRECRSRDIFTLGEDRHWTTHEKEKLIEALHRHSPSSIESISQIVGTKSAKEVEAIIEKIMNSSCLDYKKRIVEVDPEKGAAPLELWMSLVQELIREDKKTDHSELYSKVLRVIARNESLPEESGFVNLNWKNLYQYVCDLLDDKGVIQSLTNMESLVMLDMMHSLGDTLHNTDTLEERKILDLKYQLFRWQMDNCGRGNFTAGVKALSNDFTDIEYTTSTKRSEPLSESVTAKTTTTLSSSEAPLMIPPPSLSSSSSSNTQLTTAQDPNPGSSNQLYLLPIIPAQPSTSADPEPLKIQQATNLASLPPLSQSSSFGVNLGSHSLTNTFSSPSILNTTTNSTPSESKTEPENSAASNITKLHQNLCSQEDTVLSVVPTTACVSQADISLGSVSSCVPLCTETLSTPSFTTQPYQNVSIQDEVTPTKAITTGNLSKIDSSTNSNMPSNSKEGEFTVPNEIQMATSSNEHEDYFKLPELFSLNPLTIPPHLLPLKSKKDGKEVPVLIDIQ